MYEFENVPELDIQYDIFHFSKKINGAVIIRCDGKKWVFDVHNVEQTLFKVYNGWPTVICVCTHNTIFIKYDGVQFEEVKYDVFRGCILDGFITRGKG